MCLTRFASSFNVLILFFSVLLIGIIRVNAKEKCTVCRFLVATFNEGLNRTSKSHFGGGNTAWEERKLRKFTTSEIRFAEVMEFVCKQEFLSDSGEYNSKDLQFKCHALAEDVEESLEKWFFELQSVYPNLEAYICVEQLKRCCPAGHFGPSCIACPGYFSPLNETPGDETTKKPRECFGRGSCDGSGTREGTGKCNCDDGYMGKMCSNCAAHYFPLVKTADSIECEECFDGCAGGCTASGSKGCSACRTGYMMDEHEGCKDIDECTKPMKDGDDAEPKCGKEHEKCVNTPGSYRCECEDGYKRNEDAARCELDVEARPLTGVWSSDALLRAFAIVGLFGITIFVVLFHRTPLTVGLTVIALFAAFIVENHFEIILSKDTRRILDQSFKNPFH